MDRPLRVGPTLRLVFPTPEKSFLSVCVVSTRSLYIDKSIEPHQNPINLHMSRPCRRVGKIGKNPRSVIHRIDRHILHSEMPRPTDQIGMG